MPEYLFDTPTAVSTETTQCARVEVAGTVASDTDEIADRTTHSITPLFEDESTTESGKSTFAVTNALFTFGSSAAFPCNFGKAQPLVDFPSVFDASHLEAQSKGVHNAVVEGKSIFHAIQGRIPGAIAPVLIETNTTSKLLAPFQSDDTGRSPPDDEGQSKITMTMEAPPEPVGIVHHSYDLECVHQQVAVDSELDLILVLPLIQASWPSYAMSVDKTTNIVSSKLVAWAHQQTERLEAEYRHSLWLQDQPTYRYAQQDMALVLYRPEMPSATDSNPLPSRHVPNEEERLNCWPKKRVFFVDTEGNTRIIDCRKMMYDIEVVSDDGATDFDSVASPLKIVPRCISYSEPTTASSPEDSDDSIEIGATFHTQISHWSDTISISDISMSLEEDEDVIDPRLVFLPAKQVEVVELADETRPLHHDAVEVVLETKDEEFLIDYELEDAHETPEADSSTLKSPSSDGGHDELNDGMFHSSPSKLSLDDTTYEEAASSMSLEPFPDSYAKLPDPAMPEDDGGHTSEPSEASPQALPPWLAENLEDDACAAATAEAFSSGWASELMRMTFGTESFFTFLMQLDTIEENVTTEEAVVQTFLDLVDMERKKLGRNALPSSYVTGSVLASKIVPHTIFLGTISLASFLADLSFDDDGKVTIEEIYLAFKTTSATDVHYQATARTGILGALGRRLGKIFV